MGTNTTYTYDSLGRNLSKKVYDESGNPGITTSSTYDSNGNVLTQTDGTSKVTVFTYDLLNVKEISLEIHIQIIAVPTLSKSTL